jgi:DNA-binding NarL/FixJ family response regulator
VNGGYGLRGMRSRNLQAGGSFDVRTHVRRPPRDSLSAREVEVLRLVAPGLINAEIGRRLYISEATVKTHLLRLFGKLGVSDRTAAVTTAIERGDLPPPGA